MNINNKKVYNDVFKNAYRNQLTNVKPKKSVDKKYLLTFGEDNLFHISDCDYEDLCFADKVAYKAYVRGVLHPSMFFNGIINFQNLPQTFRCEENDILYKNCSLSFLKTRLYSFANDNFDISKLIVHTNSLFYDEANTILNDVVNLLIFK